MNQLWTPYPVVTVTLGVCVDFPTEFMQMHAQTRHIRGHFGSHDLHWGGGLRGQCT